MNDSVAIPTEAQWECMKFINEYINEKDNFPTIGVTASHFGVSNNTVWGHYQGLARRQLIKKVPDSQCYCRTEHFKRLIAQGGVA